MQPDRGRLLLAVLLALQGLAGCHAGTDEAFIGWQGDTYKPKDYVGTTDSEQGKGEAPQRPAIGKSTPWVETISWSPRAFIYHGFLSTEECDYLVGLGSKRVSRSMVVDSKTGGSKLDNIRTSFGGSFKRGEDPVIAQLEERIAEWTHLPPEYGEPIQVLRYMNGQQYAAHWDYFSDDFHAKRASTEGNRAATVLLYLSDVEEGGETTLPLGEPLPGAAETPAAQLSPCAARMGMAIQPKKGDALLFWDMYPDGMQQDRKSLHASCPTLKGTKWTATKWIHNKPYMGNFNALEAAGTCRDVGWDCGLKARRGLCDTDASLIGTSGTCRLTCHDCEKCPEGDVLCYRRNMRSRRQEWLEQQRRTGQAGGDVSRDKDGVLLR